MLLLQLAAEQDLDESLNIDLVPFSLEPGKWLLGLLTDYGMTILNG